MLPLISAMVPADLDTVMRLERQCFKEPWSRHMYLSDLAHNELATYLVARLPIDSGLDRSATLRHGLSLGPATVASRAQSRGSGSSSGEGSGQGRRPSTQSFAGSWDRYIPSTVERLRTQLRRGLRTGSQSTSTIVAYGGFWLIVDEAHIATIASHPDWRGCGLGLWLMLALLDQAIARGAITSTLEVRAGNDAARRLYEKLGYQVVGVRRCYYRDGEDGLIMTTPPLDETAMRERMTMVRAAAVEKMTQCFAVTRNVEE